MMRIQISLLDSVGQIFIRLNAEMSHGIQLALDFLWPWRELIVVCRKKVKIDVQHCWRGLHGPGVGLAELNSFWLACRRSETAQFPPVQLFNNNLFRQLICFAVSKDEYGRHLRQAREDVDFVCSVDGGNW